MRSFFFAFSFFMLYMTCLPCGDSMEWNDTKTTKLSAAASDHDHDYHTESCTPFCTCSCCAAPVLLFAASRQKDERFIFLSVKHPLYNVRFNAEVYNAIWQPPKFS